MRKRLVCVLVLDATHSQICDAGGYPTPPPDSGDNGPLPPLGEDEYRSPGVNYDDLGAKLEPVEGPTDKDGNCVWPFRSGKDYQKDDYVSVNGKVYQAAWGINTSPPGDGWKEVATCKGEPKGALTEEDQQTILDQKLTSNAPDIYLSKGQRVTWIFDPWTPEFLTPDQANQVQEDYLNSTPEGQRLMRAYIRLPPEEVEKIAPGRAENPDNVKRVEKFLTSERFSQLTPCRDPAYTYLNLLKAIGAFPEYCKTYTDGRNSDKICLLLLCTSFTHFAQETGANAAEMTATQCRNERHGDDTGAAYWKAKGDLIPMGLQALWYLREDKHSPDEIQSDYEDCVIAGASDWSLFFPCPGNGTYYGRGSKQLSYNANYGQFSEGLRRDTFYLLNNPDSVATSWENFASAIWFAVMPQPPKPSMVWVLDGTWQPNAHDTAMKLEPGFGSTINIINGASECGSGMEEARMAGRISKLKEVISEFGAEHGLSEDDFGRLDCAESNPFDGEGSAAINVYLAIVGKPNTCDLVNYVTPFLVTKAGDNSRCVNFYKRAHVFREKQKIYEYGTFLK